MLKKQKPAYIGMESIGLYHQTGSGTSRFLLEKSISRPPWHGPAATLDSSVERVATHQMRGALMHLNSKAGLDERLRFPRGDVRTDDLQILAGDFKGLFSVMVRYKAGVVVKGCIPLTPESVEYCD